MTWWKKFSSLRNRGEFDAELAEEMRLHIEEHTAELIREGLSPAEAIRRARAQFGSQASLGERTRDEWRLRWLEDLLSDVRYGLRSLRRSPGFLAVAVLSLALGIGVNTTLFSLTTEFLFSVPSVRDGATLWSARVGGNSHIGAEQFRFLRESNLFHGVAGYREDGEINWRSNGETRSLHAFRVSDNLFDLAGIPLALGRGIQRGDEDVVVISHAMWRSNLASDADVIGRVLELDGRPHRVIGVLPEDHRSLFGFGLSSDLYAPVRGNLYSLILVIRSADGLSQTALLERLHAAARRLDELFPDRNFKYVQNCHMDPLQGLERFKGRTMMGIAAFFAMLLTVAGLLLMIACINVSNLVLARGSARVQEFAVRASLGAGRWRLVRQILTESLLLASAGTAAGLAINFLLTRLLNRIPLDLPVQLALRMEPDWRLLAYATLLAVGCSIAVGLLPALRISRGELGVAMKSSVGGRLTLRRVLVVAQVAVSIVVLTAAVLFARNLAASAGVEPSFDLDRTMYVRVRLTPDRNQDVAKKAAFADRVQREIEALPGVRALALTLMIPMNDDATHGGSLQRDGVGERIFMRYHFNRVGPGYFATIGVPLAAGREFAAAEPADSIIVNESFARQFLAADLLSDAPSTSALSSESRATPSTPT